ncbi:hypothetical protein GW17_00004823, partial [Ensete ventricosum]
MQIRQGHFTNKPIAKFKLRFGPTRIPPHAFSYDLLFRDAADSLSSTAHVVRRVSDLYVGAGLKGISKNPPIRWRRTLKERSGRGFTKRSSISSIRLRHRGHRLHHRPRLDYLWQLTKEELVAMVCGDVELDLDQGIYKCKITI